MASPASIWLDDASSGHPAAVVLGQCDSPCRFDAVGGKPVPVAARLWLNLKGSRRDSTAASMVQPWWQH